MSLTLIDLLLVVILSQGIFLSIVIQLVPNKNIGANQMLTLLLLIASIMLFGRIAVYQFKFIYLWRVATLIDTTLFLFGPFLYCYIRRLAFNEVKLYTLKFIHFLPALLYFSYFIWTTTMRIEDFNTLYFSGNLNVAFLLTELIGLTSLIFYTIKSYQLYRAFRNNQAKEISYNQAITKYIKFLLLTLSFFILLWSFSFTSFYIFHKYSTVINYNSMWLSSSIFMYFIGFYSLTQPTIFRVPLKTEIEKVKQKNRLKQSELAPIQKALEHQMEIEKIFLKPDLNLNHLAKAIDTTSNNLSWYLNQVLNKNFYEFINTSRIEEFLNRVKHGEHQSKTLLSIALDVGFNSKSTFNNAFKTIKRDTPNNYIKTHINMSERTQNVD